MGCGPPVAWMLALGLTGFGVACGDSGTDPGGGRIVEGVDLDLLFADPQPAEIAAVQDEWAARASGAVDVSVEKDTVVAVGAVDLRVRVVGHDVAGARHYGAMVAPLEAAAPLPVIVYAHGGDGGASAEDVLTLLPFLGDLATGAIWLIPSFRSESVRFAGTVWTSDGPPSPWDRDVDDALSFLDVALDVEPLADPQRVGVLGLSRGAAVGMLMAIRDGRIDRVVEFFGPTDFFGVYVQEIVEEALRGTRRDLPGLDFLDETLIQPLKRGELTIDDVRPELIRRSTVLHADRLPPLQLHHGTADVVVAVSQVEALVATMEALGRTEPDFQAFLYPGGGHNPLTLTGSIERAVDFLSMVVVTSAGVLPPA